MKLLLIEDDRNLSDTIRDGLRPLYDVKQVFDGEEGYYYARESIYDGIIIDIMLPSMDGLKILEALRREGVNTPILMLTARDRIDDKVTGLRLGADDYLVKPFHREELTARLEAILRRSGAGLKANTVHFKQLSLGLADRSASIDGQPLLLQGKQFDILLYLINNRNIILTKEQIFTRIWGFDSQTTANVVEVYCSNLRKELKPFGYDAYVKTIRGMGYMLSDKEDGA